MNMHIPPWHQHCLRMVSFCQHGAAWVACCAHAQLAGFKLVMACDQGLEVAKSLIPHAQGAAPVLCWKPERVAGDLELSGRLMLQLDQEKGVEGNPLAHPSSDAAGAPAEPYIEGTSNCWWVCGAATARRLLLLCCVLECVCGYAL